LPRKLNSNLENTSFQIALDADIGSCT